MKYILISDAQELFKESLKRVINDDIDSEYICKFCCNFMELQQFIKKTVEEGKDSIDLIILGTNLSDIGNINNAVTKLKDIINKPILVTTTINDLAFAKGVISSGATGYTLKTLSHKNCKKIIKNVLQNKTDILLGSSTDAHDSAIGNKLTARQYEILIEISNGLLNKEIAYKLKISEATVKVHVSTILSKLSVNNRTEAVSVLHKTTHNLPIELYRNLKKT